MLERFLVSVHESIVYVVMWRIETPVLTARECTDVNVYHRIPPILQRTFKCYR